MALNRTMPGTTCDAPRPTTIVPGPGGTRVRDNTCNVEDSIGRLHSIVDELENRLNVILTPVPPTTGNAQTAPAPSVLQSDFAARVAGLGDSIEYITGRLIGIMQRIEL